MQKEILNNRSGKREILKKLKKSGKFDKKILESFKSLSAPELLDLYNSLIKK